MILLLTLFLCGTLCQAQTSSLAQSMGFPNGVNSPFSQANSLSSAGTPFASGSASASAGTSRSSASASAGSPDYATCVKSQPETAVKSYRPLAYSLLEATFTNPALKDFYATNFNTDDFYQAIYDELKGAWLHRARSTAGSWTLLFEYALPRVSPLVNAVSITNALSEFISSKTVITTERYDDFVDAYVNAISKGLKNEDGSRKSPAEAVASALLNYLSEKSDLTYTSLHEFIATLAINYRFAIYYKCIPSTFKDIPSP